MKIIVTHKSPDLDAITSVWLIIRFLNGWENATIEFVAAGSKLSGNYKSEGSAIEIVDEHEVIHVDTGLGRLDHHDTSDDKISAASKTLDFILERRKNEPLHETKKEALKRMVKVVVLDDHFKEVERVDITDDYHEFETSAILEGLELMYPLQDEKNLMFVCKILDAILHNFENRIWAECEIKEKGVKFETKFGKALGVETINDATLKLAQKMGYIVVVRKDPQSGKVRIKAHPKSKVDLSSAFDQLKKMDSDASWFLHVSKKMLLNGSSKNPQMKGSTLTLDKIIEVIKKL